MVCIRCVGVDGGALMVARLRGSCEKRHGLQLAGTMENKPYTAICKICLILHISVKSATTPLYRKYIAFHLPPVLTDHGVQSLQQGDAR